MTLVWNPRTLLVGAALLLPGTAIAQQKSPGQVAFETNCMACHLLDLKGVGSSSVSMVATYPEGQEDAFYDWP